MSKTEWKECTLGDVCSSVSETYSRNDSYVVLINTSDVLEGKFLTHELVPNENLKGQFKKTFQKDDILYSEIRPANKRFAYVDFEDTERYIASTKLMVIRPNQSVIDSKYLYCILTSKDFLDEMQHLAETRSGTFPQITFSSEVATYPISLPSLAEQQRIAGILSSLDDKIELNNTINKNLEEQAQTLFKNYVENESCQEMKITDIADLNPDSYNLKDNWSHVNYLDTSSITQNVVSELQLISLSDEKLPSRAKRKVCKGDIVYSTVRPNQLHYGIIDDVKDNMLVSTGFTVVRSKNPLVSNAYLYLYLTQKDIVEKLQQIAEQSTSTFPAIKPSDIGECVIKVFEEHNASVLNNQLVAIFDKISQNNQENQRLTTLRDTLLPKLMSGEE